MYFDEIIELVKTEFKFAIKEFKPFNSAHEGYAVILEEMDELWQNVKLNQKKNPNRERLMLNECIQVCAMSIRFIQDCCKNLFE